MTFKKLAIALAVVFTFSLSSIAPVATLAPVQQALAQEAPAAAPASDPLRPIARTHTLPPYPPISVRLNEQGTTLMLVHITVEGNVDTCKVEGSSSSDRLDQASCDFVKSHWRWQPPTNKGVPTDVSTRVSVKWDLKDAR